MDVNAENYNIYTNKIQARTLAEINKIFQLRLVRWKKVLDIWVL